MSLYHSGNNERGRRWERFLARWFGMPILRRPGEDWPDADPALDFIMAFHYCPTAKQYRFDRHYEALSRAERFTCGACGATYLTRGVIGILCLRIKDACELSSRHRSSIRRTLAFNRFLVFGFGKHLPDTRDGKTSGELEREALTWFAGIIYAAACLPARLL